MASFGDGKEWHKIRVTVEYLDQEGNQICKSGLAIRGVDDQEQFLKQEDMYALLEAGYQALLSHHKNKLDAYKKFSEQSDTTEKQKCQSSS